MWMAIGLEAIVEWSGRVRYSVFTGKQHGGINHDMTASNHDDRQKKTYRVSPLDTKEKRCINRSRVRSDDRTKRLIGARESV